MLVMIILNVNVYGQEPIDIYNSLVNKFRSCPKNEEDWNRLMSAIDDSIEELKDINLADLSYQDKKNYESIRDKIEGAQALVGELNPYDGRNYSLTNSKRAKGTYLFDDAGVEYRDWYDGSNEGITMFYISVWNGCHMARMMYNRSDCLHSFNFIGLNGNSMSGGVSGKSFRYLETITKTTNDQKYRKFTFEKSSNQFSCN